MKINDELVDLYYTQKGISRQEKKRAIFAHFYFVR